MASTTVTSATCSASARVTCSGASQVCSESQAEGLAKLVRGQNARPSFVERRVIVSHPTRLACVSRELGDLLLEIANRMIGEHSGPGG